MRSETSYFNKTVFWNDQRRFWPLTAGYALLWLLLLPLSRLTELDHASPYLNPWNVQYDTLNLAANAGYWVAFCTAILFAMAAFSYLTASRATNGLHALPLRRETQYATHCLAGLCAQLAVQLLAVVLTAAVLASRGAFDARILGLSLLALALPTVFFFSFGVLCMVFTGQILAAPVFYGILNVLAVSVEMLVRTFAGNFLYGWSGNDSPSLMALSPIVELVMHGVRATTETYTHLPDGSILSDNSAGGRIRLLGLDWLLIYAAVGLVLAALALLVYRKRHSEATGSTVAIYWARPVFKYGVTFCAALALGQLLYYLFFGQYRASGDYSLPGTLLCMAAAGLLGYFAAEMLLKKSFRVWKTGWKGAVTVTAVLVALGCVLSFDLTGYEAYVPDAGEIESASFDLYTYGTGAACSATVRDAETLRLLTDVHRALVNDKQRQHALNGGVPADMDDSTFAQGSFYVAYRLRNGAAVSRHYSFFGLYAAELDDPASPAAALTALYNDPDIALSRTLDRYRYSPDGDPRSLEDLRFTGGYVETWHSQTGFSSSRDLTAAEARQLFGAAVRDAEARRIGDSLFGSVPMLNGNVELYGSYRGGEAGDAGGQGRSAVSFHLTVTEQMTETVAALRSMGIEPGFL